jgi:hypothetical protein
MMLKRILLYCILLFGIHLNSQVSHASWDDEMVEVILPIRAGILMNSKKIFEDNWHELPQTDFWKKIIRLSPDSCIINVASTREILLHTSKNEWNSKNRCSKKTSLNQI